VLCKRWRWLAPLLICLAQLVAFPARASTVFGWGRLESSLELRYEQDRQTTAYAYAPSYDYYSSRFREQLHLRGRGLYIVDPRLVTINLGAGIEFFQENNDFAGQSGSQDGRLHNYSFDSTFFSRKPYNLFLYANQTEDRVSRTFGTRTNIKTAAEGARFSLHEDSFLKDWGIPYFSTSLAVNQLKINEDSSGSGQDFHRNEEHDILQYDAHKGYQTADLTLQYRYDDLKDSLRADTGFTTNTANLYYSVDFGPTLNWRWNSINNYVQRSGLSGNNSLTTNQDLRIYHNVDLYSNYRYTHSRYETASGTTATNTLTFLVSQRWYNNLTASLHALGSHTDLPEGTTKTYGAGPGLNYRRNISPKGRLLLHANGTYRINDNDLQTNQIKRENEPHQVAPSFPVGDPGFLLENPFVVESSIVVVDRRDGSEFATTEGLDYEVINEGDSTRIRPLPTSVILQAGDPLEVSYTYVVAPSIRYSTTLLSVGGTIDFGWISFSAAHDSSNQQLLEGADRGYLQDRTTDTASVRVRGRWRQMLATADAAYQQEDSSYQKYSRWRFGQSVSYPGFHGMTLSANASESFATYTVPRPRQSDSYAADLALNGVIAARWITRAYAGLLILKDSEIEDQTIGRAGIDVKRIIGRLTISGDLLWNEFDRGFANTTDRRIDLRAIRRF